MSRHNVKDWIVCLSGFTQNHGNLNGISRLWADLHNSWTGPPQRVIQYHTWHINAENLAEFIFRLRPDEGRPRILITGYSWGGQTALNLASELNERGLPVARMVLCDPIYRYPMWIGRWTAFLDRIKLTVPPNVDELHWFYQRRNKPSGHEPVASDGSTTLVHGGVELKRTHEYMDDAQEYHDKVHECAQEVFD